MSSVLENAFLNSGTNSQILANTVTLPFLFDAPLVTLELFVENIYKLLNSKMSDSDAIYAFDGFINTMIKEADRIGARFCDLKDLDLVDLGLGKELIHGEVFIGSGLIEPSIRYEFRPYDPPFTAEAVRNIFRVRKKPNDVKELNTILNEALQRIMMAIHLLMDMKEDFKQTIMDTAQEESLETRLSPGLLIRGLNISKKSFYDGVDLIDKALNAFKKRNIDLKFVTSLKCLYFIGLPSNHGTTLGLYTPSFKEMAINIPELEKKTEEFAASDEGVIGFILNHPEHQTYRGAYTTMVPYAFIHEFAHHLYFHYLNEGSIKYWEHQYSFGENTSEEDLREAYLDFVNNFKNLTDSFFEHLFMFTAKNQYTSKGRFLMDLQSNLDMISRNKNLAEYQAAKSCGLIKKCEIQGGNLYFSIDAEVILGLYKKGPSYVKELQKISLSAPKLTLDEFIEFTKYVLVRGGQVNPETTQAVTDYGNSSTEEDFAEAFAWYVLKPDILTENKTNRLLRCLYLSGLVNNGVFKFGSNKNLKSIAQRVASKYSKLKSQ